MTVRWRIAIMRVAIDARTIVEKSSGVGLYTERFLNALKKTDVTNEYIAVMLKDIARKASYNGNFRIKTTTVPINRHPMTELWENTCLYTMLLRNKVDIFHSTGFSMPFMPLRRTKKVVTIYDMIAFIYPEAFPKKFVYYIKMITACLARTVDHIIAISENTKNDIIKHLHVDEKKVSVVYGGVGEEFQVLDEEESRCILRERHAIEKDFILFVGNIEYRKNIGRLIQAFDDLHDRDDILLVIVGAYRWQYHEIQHIMGKVRNKERILFLDYISTNDLIHFYNCALLFAYPSLYEGFGLPPLEAMACGCPVVVSRAASLPEVVGDAGLYVDPYDVAQLRDTMERVMSDTQLRHDMVRKGLKRTQDFTWKQNAINTCSIYRQIAG